LGGRRLGSIRMQMKTNLFHVLCFAGFSLSGTIASEILDRRPDGSIESVEVFAIKTFDVKELGIEGDHSAVYVKINHAHVPSSGMKWISRLSAIEELIFGEGPEGVSVENGDVSAIGGLSSLEYLNLCVRNLESSDYKFLEQMDGLTGLCIQVPFGYELQISKRMVSAISKIKKLEGIRILASGFSDEMLKVLAGKESLNSISIHFHDSPDFGGGLKELVGNARIESLSLSGVAIGPEFFDSITEDSALQLLSLELSGVPASFIERLIPLKKLQFLRISSPAVSSDALRVLSTHPTLESIDIQNAEFSEEIGEWFDGNPVLKRYVIGKSGPRRPSSKQ